MQTPSLKEQRLAEFNQVVKTLMLKNAKKDMPWYDAIWLRRFVVARKLIEKHQPAKLAEFIQACAPLHTDPNFEIKQVKDVFNPDVLQKIKRAITLIPDSTYQNHEVESFGRLSVQNDPYFLSFIAL